MTRSKGLTIGGWRAPARRVAAKKDCIYHPFLAFFCGNNSGPCRTHFFELLHREGHKRREKIGDLSIYPHRPSPFDVFLSTFDDMNIGL